MVDMLNKGVLATCEDWNCSCFRRDIAANFALNSHASLIRQIITTALFYFLQDKNEFEFGVDRSAIEEPLDGRSFSTPPYLPK